MSKDPIPKPTNQQLVEHMKEAIEEGWMLFPLDLPEQQLIRLAGNPEGLEQMKTLETDYVIYAAAGLIHGEGTKGLFTVKPEVTPGQVLELVKKNMAACYREHGITDSDEGLAKRFAELDKWAYFFASSVYPDVPKRKPSVDRIQTLLSEASETIQKKFPGATGAKGTPGQRKTLMEWESYYVEAAVVELIHGADTPGFGQTAGFSAGEYKEQCIGELTTLYAALDIKKGDLAYTEKFHRLDKIAKEFARSVYPDLPKQR